MRPLRLFLESFGPYRNPTELDFTLLRDNPLLLITGPTGGGKTALLDAMSFALYCRATGGRRSFAAMRCSSSPEESPTTVEFDFSLLGKTYRFRRSLSVRVNRNTGERRLKDTHECFVREEEGFTLLESGSESAVRKKAEELLHLSCEQFSQVVVLPQGEFLRLLRAGSREKGEILETLFSAGLWRELMESFSTRLRALENDVTKLSAKRDSLLSQAELSSCEELSEALKALVKKEEARRKEAEALQKELREKEKLLRLLEEFERKKTALEKAQATARESGKKLKGLQDAAVLTEEKRKKVQALRQQAVCAARESAAVQKQREEWERLQEQKKKAEELSLQLKAEEKALEKQRELGKELSGRLSTGESFVHQAQESAALLPALLEEEGRLQSILSAFSELDALGKSREETQRALREQEKRVQAKKLLADTLSERLASAEAILRGNSALALSHSLKPGEPCPVCGALEHPHPASGAEQALEPGAIELLREEEQNARQEALKAISRHGVLAESAAKAKEQEEKQQTVTQGFAISREQAEKKAEENRSLLETHRTAAGKLSAAREKLLILRQEKEKQDALEQEITLRAAGLKASHKEAYEAFVQAQQEHPLNGEALSRLMSEKQQEYRRLEQEAEALQKECEQEVASLKAAQEEERRAKEEEKAAQAEFSALSPSWETPPELAALYRETQEKREASLAFSEELGELKNRISVLQVSLAALKEVEEKLQKAEALHRRAARLSHSLSGTNAFKTPILQYVLSIMLDEVLESSNRFFDTLSRGRYALRRMEGPKSGHSLGGLDIEVLDGSSMLPRSIETLSGGEQFLASLSLAFGLSDVVQSHSGAVHLDSIFIDEGFGSLDTETLNTAMKALAMIQGSGKLVGVISHVSELRGRIGACIEVSRDSSGSSKAAIKC